MKKVAVACTLLSLLTVSGAGATEVEEILRELQPARLGVDAQGNLWLLHSSWMRVTLVSVEGRRHTVRIPKSWYVDVDSRWGVVGLDPYGKELRVISPAGEVQAVLPMEHEAGDVAWIDEARVAVTPKRAAHRVEIWDVKTGSLVRTFGKEEAIDHRIGAYFVRGVAVEYHEASKKLHTLEARTGDYRLFDLEGRQLAAYRLENPRLAEFQAWIEQVDRERTRMGEDLGIPMNWLRLGIDASGAAITVAGCTEDGAQARLLRVPGDGPVETLELDVACCTRNLAIWQDSIVFAEAPSAAQDGCYLRRSYP